MWDNSLNHHLIYNFVSHSVSHDFIIAGMQPTNRFLPPPLKLQFGPKESFGATLPNRLLQTMFPPRSSADELCAWFWVWFFFFPPPPSCCFFPSLLCVEVASLSIFVCAGACNPNLQRHLGIEVSQTYPWAVLLLSTIVYAGVKRDKWHECYQWEHTRNCYLLLSSSSQNQQYL